MADDDHLDDTTMALAIQSFLDEWNYRVLHSGLAATWDQTECVSAVLDLFECCGLQTSPEERSAYCEMDETAMVQTIVSKMPMEVRKAFEPFALQLKLVMSAASRVRCALDEGTPEDVAKMMEEGDAGVNQQILKQTIIMAAMEVSEQNEVLGSWESNMTKRLGRLGKCQEEADKARNELDQISSQLQSFGADQNTKSKKVLMSIAGASDKVLMVTSFKGWFDWKVRYCLEKDVHEKFQAEISASKERLMSYKQARVANIRKVLMGSADGAAKMIQQECFKALAKNVQAAKEDKELQSKVDAAAEKMSSLKAGQKENAKKTMQRLSAGNDSSLLMMTFTEWAKMMGTLKQEAEYEKQVKNQQDKLAEYMKSKSDQAKGVLSRLSGSTDTGLMGNAFVAWKDEIQAEKKARELEETMNSQMDKFKSLNGRMKTNAMGKAARSIDLENENLIMQMFMAWATEARLDRIYSYYSGKLDNKKNQLEAVQTMFKSFANQLEQGIASTPRTNRKAGRSSSRANEKGEKPPALPSGGAA